MTAEQALFQLRCAAAEWLREHPDDPNAPAVANALFETAEKPWTDCIWCGKPLTAHGRFARCAGGETQYTGDFSL